MLKISRPSRRMKFSRRSKAEIDEIICDYLSGVRVKDIVYKYSISSTSINEYVVRAGYKLRNPFTFDWNKAKLATEGVRKDVQNYYGGRRRENKRS